MARPIDRTVYGQLPPAHPPQEPWPQVTTMEILRYLGQRDRLFMPFMAQATPTRLVPECLMAGDARERLYYAYVLHVGYQADGTELFRLPRLLEARNLEALYIDLTCEVVDVPLFRWRPVIAPRLNPEQYRRTILLPALRAGTTTTLLTEL